MQPRQRAAPLPAAAQVWVEEPAREQARTSPAVQPCSLRRCEARSRSRCSCWIAGADATQMFSMRDSLRFSLGRGHVGKRAGEPRLRVCRSGRGIPDREAKLQLVKALLAHGANPNLQMTARPPGYGGTGTGGYNDAAGATAFILAANAADVEMMRLLLTAGADPRLATKTNSNALLAATALNRGIGEIIDDEDSGDRGGQIPARRGCRPQGRHHV